MQFVLSLHSLLRWAIVLVGLWTFINSLSGAISSRKFATKDNLSNLLFMIFCDLQLVFGLILYFGNGWFSMLTNNAKEVMHNSISRFFTVEHSLMMIIAWVLVHIGRAAVKKASTDELKFKRMLVYFGFAILLILIAIPWPFRQLGDHPWFRGF